MANELHVYVSNNGNAMTTALNGLGLCHLSPCSDVGFKKIMNGDTDEDRRRSIRFISAFCKIFDRSGNQACRALDVGTILGNRRIESMEKIPESFDHDGNVVLPAPQNGVMRGR